MYCIIKREEVYMYSNKYLQNNYEQFTFKFKIQTLFNILIHII